MTRPGAGNRAGRQLRVVHVITTLTTGGAERQVELIAGASRHDVRVISLYEGGVVELALRAKGIPVQILGMDGWRKAAAIPRLARLLRAHAPDVVHVHLLSAQLWGIPAARLAHVPVIVSTEHSIMQTTIEGRPKSEPLRRLYLALERMATATVAVSDATVQRLHDWGVPGTGSMPVINPPIDFGNLRTDGSARGPVRAELGIPLEAGVVGSVGRLDVVKRHQVLIEALADQLRTGLHLVIVGDGPLRADLEQLSRTLGVQPAVHLTGPRPDVARVLEAVDVFASPSRDETFGMAVVEALGAGLPVVYAQAPALDGFALDPARVRVLARDTEPASERAELATAVGELIAMAPQRADAPEQLVARYGVERTAAAVDDLYDRLSAGRPASAR